MSTLTLLGIISLVVVILFTWAAYTSDDSGTGQTRREAIIEVVIGIFIGFSVNFAMNILLLPLVGATLSAFDNFSLGAVYTLVSIVRSYIVRRWADRHIRQVAEFLSCSRGQMS